MDTQTLSGSSPAEVEDVFRGEYISVEEANRHKATGELPARFRTAEPAESAPADPQAQQSGAVDEDSSDIAPDSDKGKDNQEHQKQAKKPRTAEDRVAQLEAAVEREWEKAEPDLKFIAQSEATLDKIRAGQKRKTEPAPVVQPEPQSQPQQPLQAASYDAWEQKFIAEEAQGWVEQWAKEHPDKPFESANAAMFRHMRSVERQFEQRLQEQKAFDAKIADLHARYEDFDAVVLPSSKILMEANLPQEVYDEINKSKFNLDIQYLIGKDPEQRRKFISLAKTDPREARSKILELERVVRDGFANPGKEFMPERDESGKFKAKEAPEPKKTSAPKPPSPVSGGSARVFDENDDSGSADDWMKGRNAQKARKP